MLSRIRRLRRSRLRRRTNNLQIFPILVVGTLCFCIAILIYHILFSMALFTPGITRTLLMAGMPSIGSESIGYPGWQYTARSVVYMLTNYDLGNPRSFFESSIPILAQAQSYQVWQERAFVFVPELTFAPEPRRPVTPAPEPSRPEIIPGERPRPQGPEVQRPVISERPQVLIYHTHTSEMYLGSQARQNLSNAHYVFRSVNDDKVTGVMEVGRHLANALQNLGVPTLHETRIHDFPSLAYSYVNSEKTVRDILARERDIQMVFDLHRDANVPDPVIMIDGKRVARILFVVGTAQDIPRSHPEWEKNLAFARQLQSAVEQRYPGLMRPMQVRRDARYNQHLHPASIIIEVGSVENTLEEALLAAELFATVVADVINQR